MCRLFAYLGPRLPLRTLLVDPPNSLVNQSRGPQHHPLLQLAGWGFALWDQSSVLPDSPLLYKRACPAFFDDNLKTLVPSLAGEQLLAHVRAATYRPEGLIADENCHPFSFKGAPWTIAHNGFLLDWQVMQAKLYAKCKSEWVEQRRGTTDTELVYCLFLSILADYDDPYDFESLRAALAELVHFLVETGREFDNHKPLKLKLIFAHKNRLLAVNYGAGENGQLVLDGDLEAYREAPIDSPEFLKSTLMEPLYIKTGCHFKETPGHYQLQDCQQDLIDTVLIASEPLSDEGKPWEQLGFGEMLLVERLDDGKCTLQKGQVFESI